ncbi:helix-turn-helix domain-containing protein [Streptomyces sp. NPDC048172]|uniref:helix-turn-helix domain-containing protein n=1 Tax=Streptomyces sp. NPDC048172 TaxID=3365505 RepID=UPI00371E3DC6
MANIKRLDPGESPLHFFGAELRFWRERAGLTLAGLGTKVFLTGSQIGQYETAVKRPKDEHIPRLDAAVGASGALVRAWEMARRHPLPRRLRKIAEIESTSKTIRAFQPQVVYGLLQTEGYARAVLGVIDRSRLDDDVAARMARQRLLAWEDAPKLWLVLGEGVLYQEMGGRATMRTQLSRLLSYRHSERVFIQVLPFRAGAHAGMIGAFNLYTYERQPTTAYAETYGRVVETADPHEVEEHAHRYDLLRASALSLEDSAELIARVREERYGHHPGRNTHPLA